MSKQEGSCHCGKIKFEVDLDLNQEALSCNCSICQRKGTLLFFVGDDKFRLISGEKDLTDYQFGKKAIHHTFCSVCGVTAFASSHMPDGTPMKAINIRCLENINLDDVGIKKFDGRSI